MTVRRRSAKIDLVLVRMDGPQLITLNSMRSRILALAIPSPEGSRLFFGTTVSQKDWTLYLRQAVDLRYLFTFSDQRVTYIFDLAKIDGGKVMMEKYDGEAPEEYLPLPRFFAENHTEDVEDEDRPSDNERLILDGDWELQEFGQFQQRYTDLYAFSIAMTNWRDPATSPDRRKAIKLAFTDRPFKGGFSYVHLFADLNDNVPMQEQLHLNAIKYASPGHVDMEGAGPTFQTVNETIATYLDNRAAIKSIYNDLHAFLSKNRYLAMRGSDYLADNAPDVFITREARKIADALPAVSYDEIYELASRNTLVAVKIVLSFYRRLDEAARFFAQGRVSFNDD